MQVYFQSLFWSYLPRVLTILTTSVIDWSQVIGYIINLIEKKQIS